MSILGVILTLLYAIVGFVLTAYLDRLDPESPGTMPIATMLLSALTWPAWLTALGILMIAAYLSDRDCD